MPVTFFQEEILGFLSENRSPESHFAGGVILTVDPGSVRYSHDFDIFHDTVTGATGLAEACDRDVSFLEKNGYEIKPTTEWTGTDTFRKAIVGKNNERTEIDWAVDSDFRFFPVEQDEKLGWRLHHFDVATNKGLALSARSETRDYIDILQLSRRYSLEAICWAACGKDPGFSPLSLLKMMRRFAKIVPGTLEKIQAVELDPIAMKEEWTDYVVGAEEALERVGNDQPDLPIGCAFLDAEGKPCWIENADETRIHLPSRGGTPVEV